MTHVRQQVRDAAVADLTGLHTTTTHVYSGRSEPLTGGELPGLNVLLQDETSAFDALGSSKIARTGRLIVEGWAKANGDALLDLLDTIAAEVETRIYSPAGTPTLDGKLMNIGTPSTQIDFPGEADGKQRVGVVRILIPVTYRTAAADPSTIA